MLNLDLIETFVTVRRLGSFSAAARELGVSQPAVSDRIARLEQHLGTTLLTRSVSGAETTAAGEAFAGATEAAIGQLRAATTTEPMLGGGIVRIGGAGDVIASRVVPALAPLSTQGLRLHFTLGLAPHLLDDLEAGRLDLVIATRRPSGANLRSRGLIDEEFVLVGSPSLAKTIDDAKLAEAPAEALRHLPLVSFDPDLSIIRRYWRSQFGRRPANPVAVVIPDLRGILAAVIAGAGISALPRYLAEPALMNGTVRQLHRPEVPPINTLYLTVNASAPPSPAVGAVITRLVDAAAEWEIF